MTLTFNPNPYIAEHQIEELMTKVKARLRRPEAIDIVIDRDYMILWHRETKRQIRFCKSTGIDWIVAKCVKFENKHITLV